MTHDLTYALFSGATPAYAITDCPNGLIHLTPLTQDAAAILERWADPGDLGEILTDPTTAEHIIECLELHDLFGTEG